MQIVHYRAWYGHGIFEAEMLKVTCVHIGFQLSTLFTTNPKTGALSFCSSTNVPV